MSAANDDRNKNKEFLKKEKKKNSTTFEFVFHSFGRLFFCGLLSTTLYCADIRLIENTIKCNHKISKYLFSAAPRKLVRKKI